MSKVETPTWPSLASFALIWIGTALSTWGLVCLLAPVFIGRDLERGLIHGEVLLALALIPISMGVLVVQTILFMIGRTTWPNSPRNNKLLLLLGTPALTWLCLRLLVYVAGGAASFIPRI